MKKIKPVFLGLLLLLTALWLWADPTLFNPPYVFRATREALMNYTGIIAMGVMSVSMILAVRPVRLEPYLGGLDKMYRLHKWLGITGLVMSIVHWAIKESPGWLSALGLIEPIKRGAPPPGGAQPAVASLEQFFSSMRHTAESVGEQAFYVSLVLLSLALIKRFPYRYFFKTHRFMPLVYLALVFHSIFLMKFSYWTQAVGPLMGALMLAGVVSAFIVLFRKVGHERRAAGVVESFQFYPDSRVLRVDIKMTGHWDGHQAGQFAFVTFDHGEAAHPFTIASNWHNDGKIFFLIKELGDYTDTLASKMKVGEPVTLEGPYGQFTFKSDKPRQIWVAGGIGITPFIARMRNLAHAPSPTVQQVDLFYGVSEIDEDGLTHIREDAAKANVNFHLYVEATDGRISAERICQTVPDWANADVWFCGPAAFGDALSADFVAKGMSADDIHRELFEMR